MLVAQVIKSVPSFSLFAERNTIGKNIHGEVASWREK